NLFVKFKEKAALIMPLKELVNFVIDFDRRDILHLRLQTMLDEAMAGEENPLYSSDPKATSLAKLRFVVERFSSIYPDPKMPAWMDEMIGNYLSLVTKNYADLLIEIESSKTLMFINGFQSNTNSSSLVADLLDEQEREELALKKPAKRDTKVGQKMSDQELGVADTIMFGAVDLDSLDKFSLNELIGKVMNDEDFEVADVHEKIITIIGDYTKMREAASKARNSNESYKKFAAANAKLFSTCVVISEAITFLKQLSTDLITQLQKDGDQGKLKKKRIICSEILEFLLENENKLAEIYKSIQARSLISKDAQNLVSRSPLKDSIYGEFVLGETGKVRELLASQMSQSSSPQLTKEYFLEKLGSEYNKEKNPEIKRALQNLSDQILMELQNEDEIFNIAVQQVYYQKPGAVLSYVQWKIDDIGDSEEELGLLYKRLDIRAGRLNLFKDDQLKRDLDNALILVNEEMTKAETEKNPLYAAILTEIGGDKKTIDSYVKKRMKEIYETSASPASEYTELMIDIGYYMGKYQATEEVHSRLASLHKIVKKKQESFFETEIDYDKIKEVKGGLKDNFFGSISDTMINSGSWLRDKIIKPTVSGVWGWLKRKSRALVFTATAIITLLVGGSLDNNSRVERLKLGQNLSDSIDKKDLAGSTGEAKIFDTLSEEAEKFFSEFIDFGSSGSQVASNTGQQHVSNHDNQEEDAVEQGQVNQDESEDGEEVESSDEMEEGVKSGKVELKYVSTASVPANGTMWEMAKKETQMKSLNNYQRCVVMRLLMNEVNGESRNDLWVHEGEILLATDDDTAVKLWNAAVDDGTAEKILIAHWRGRGYEWGDIAGKLHKVLKKA
ncbi:hypothetical protein ACFL21_05410, partial [Patescibacteria group bacterium]